MSASLQQTAQLTGSTSNLLFNELTGQHLKIIEPLCPEIIAPHGKIKIEDFNEMCSEFVNNYLGKSPVIFKGLGDQRNQAFRRETSKEHFKLNWGHLPVALGTANTHTGREWRKGTIESEWSKIIASQDVDNSKGNETFYLFGSHFGDDWERLLQLYEKPNLPSESLLTQVDGLVLESLCDQDVIAKLHVSPSFGIAGRNTGVPFHFHGPGFLEMIHGAKIFFLYPPNKNILGHYENKTTFEWTWTTYPETNEERPISCWISKSDILYFPNQFLHATLNVQDYNVFLASFA